MAHFFGYEPLTALAYLQLQGLTYNTDALKTPEEPTNTNDTTMTDATQPEATQPSETQLPETTQPEESKPEETKPEETKPEESKSEEPKSEESNNDITPLLQKLLNQTAKLKVEEQQIKDKKPQAPVPAAAAATPTPNGQAKPAKPKPVSAKRRTPAKHAKKNSESGLVVDLRGPEFTVHDKGYCYLLDNLNSYQRIWCMRMGL